MTSTDINVAILQLGILSGALVGVGGAALAGMNGYAMLSAGLLMAPLSLGAALSVIALRRLATRASLSLAAEVPLIAFGTLAGGLIVGAIEQAIGFPYYSFLLWVATLLGIVAVGSIVGAVIGQRARLQAAAPAV